jgi:hypothetical protein
MIDVLLVVILVLSGVFLFLSVSKDRSWTGAGMLLLWLVAAILTYKSVK